MENRQVTIRILGASAVISGHYEVELEEYLRIPDPNRWFSKAFKEERWDGMKKFYHGSTFPAGLTDYLIEKYAAIGVDTRVIERDFEPVDLSRFNNTYLPGITLRVDQVDSVRAMMEVSRGILKSGTGCHRRGQEIMRWDGSLVRVEDIQVGDKLRGLSCGDDPGCRTVAALCRGTDEMYEVRPKQGESFVVNSDHVLTLYCPYQGGDLIDITVREWLHWTRYAPRAAYALLRVPPAGTQCIEFDIFPTGTVEPYFGFTLDGDGRYLLDDFTVTHNSGKTELATCIARLYWEERGWQTLIVVPKKGLMHQTAERLQKYYGSDISVGLLGDSVREPGIVTVATAQTLQQFESYKKDKMVRGRKMPQIYPADPIVREIAQTREVLILDECFPAGTLVDGRPIEDLCVGDVITSFDDSTQQLVDRPISRLFVREPSGLVTIHFYDGRSITCTPNHPFWTLDGWVAAACLLNKMVAVTRRHELSSNVQGSGISYVRVDRVEVHESGDSGTYGGRAPSGLVYNIEVEGTHTYTVNGAIVHNCHHSSSGSWFDFCQFSKAKVRLGMSGSPLKNSELSDFRVLAATGSVIRDVPSEVLVSDGSCAKPKIAVVRNDNAEGPELPREFISYTKVSGKEATKTVKMPYPLAYRVGYVENHHHNTAVVRATAWLVDHGKRTLVLCRKKAHWATLHEMLEEQGIDHLSVWGATAIGERDRAKRLLDQGKLKCILASTIFDEGEDVPGIDAMVLAEGVEVNTNAIQRVGRGMRKKGGDNDVWIVDFFMGIHPDLAKHSDARVKAWLDAHFEVLPVLEWPEPDEVEYDHSALLPFLSWDEKYAEFANAP